MTHKIFSINERAFEPQVYERFKAGFGRLLQKAGGVDKSATLTRVGGSALYQMASVNETRHFPPIDVIADIEKQAGDPILTRLLAELAGFSLVPVQPVKINGSFSRLLANLGKEVSDVFSDAAKALEDDRMTPREAKGLLLDIDEAMSALSLLRNGIREVAESSPSTFKDMMKAA